MFPPAAPDRGRLTATASPGRLPRLKPREETTLTLLDALITFAAVLALAGLNWWLGRSGRLARARGEASVRLRDDLIDFVEREGDDANDGRARVAVGAAGDLAVAIALGDGWVTRRVRPGSVRQVSRHDANVAVRLRDFTLPALVLSFADSGRASVWEQRMAALAAPAGSAHVPA
jgi:hypothetical protein